MILKIKNFSIIQIYDCELEKVFELSETLETFNLIVGKNKQPSTKDDKFQCRFKVSFGKALKLKLYILNLKSQTFILF